jgi:hypothetical protein
MSRTLLNIIGDDIIGAIFKIGNIHVHQLKNGEWHAYVVAWDDRQEDIIAKQAREVYVKQYMSGRHIDVVKDDNGDIITGATRKELIKKIKKESTSWWIMFNVFWTRT